MNTIRLLMLNYEFPPIGGGAGKAHLCVLKEFATHPNLKIDVLTSKPTPGLSFEKFADNITIHKVGIKKPNLHLWKRSEVIKWLIKASSQYRKLIRSNEYDMVHAFFAFPTGFLPWFNNSKLPYIISLRGSDVPGINSRFALEYKILGPLFTSIWKKADILVACSQGLAQRASRFMPQLNYQVIPNGVDISNFKCERQSPLKEPIKLVTAGRLSSTKKFDTLIKAVEILNSRSIDVTLTIAGDGALHQSLNEMVDQTYLADKIKFSGRLDTNQMPDFYAQGDIFLSASIQEGMSNAMLEAMASGLPIIAARCEGVDELIAGNGIVLDDASPKAFAESVNLIVNDSDCYSAMSDAAVKAAAKFTWSSVADQYMSLYKSICTPDGGSA